MKTLEVSNLSKLFTLNAKQRRQMKTTLKSKQALNDLSFTAYPGEIFGLLGPNGAGKTTALRIISTLINADNGTVLLEGENIAENGAKARSNIGFLTTDLKLEEHFTPNYLFTFFGKLYGMSEIQIESRKRFLFQDLGIDRFAEVKVGELSTGMRQKVSIAVSLVHDPSYIIFDEPTNGLDIITVKTITDYLLRLKDEDKTIIISTHVFSVVEKLCDRAGIVIDGKMIVCDTIHNLKKRSQNSLENLFFQLIKGKGEKCNE